jgi:hypothetical protein
MRKPEDPCRDPASEARDDHASEPRATPETDARVDHCLPRLLREAIDADFSRRLERQRDELLEALEAMLDLWHKAGGNESDWAVEKSEAAIAAVKGGNG